MYSCGATVTPVWPTCAVCGYHPASVAARDAPTAAPNASANCSISAKFSAVPTPRPPAITADASDSEGRPPTSGAVRSTTDACRPSATGTSTTTTEAVAGAATGVTLFGRTVTIGCPRVTLACTTVEPPNTDCSTTTVEPSSATSTASVSTPASSRTPSRPAIAASSNDTTETTTDDASAAGSQVSTAVAPNCASFSTAAADALPATTATGEPRRPANVSNSSVGFPTTPSELPESTESTSTSTSAMKRSCRQRSLRDTRNSAMRVPASPSSFTIVRSPRGGRCVESMTAVAAAARPTDDASIPRSASDQVEAGLVLAAIIPLNEGYLGSLIFSSTLTTAGSSAETTAWPTAVCRCTRTAEPSTETLLASVACGTPSRSASIAGSTPMRASVDSDPSTTRSNSIRSIAFASTNDVASASEPCKASSTTCTDSSAPIDSALRNVSVAFAGPIVSTITVVPSVDSLMRSASSTA